MKTNKTFQHFLQKEMLKRSKANPSFSIRGFARQLNIEQSSLAQILSSKRNLTDQMCIRIGEKLNLRPSKIDSLLGKRMVATKEHFGAFDKLQEDQFSVIADWHYFAILELIGTDGFESTISYVAKALGISTALAREGVECLKRLQYVKIDKNGKWVDCLQGAVNVGNQFTAPSFREHQKQLLKKAIEAVDQIEYAERVQSSMTFVGSRDRVEEAKKRILIFIEELDEFMKGGDAKDEVYSLSVSLFPLSQIKQKRSQKKELV